MDAKQIFNIITRHCESNIAEHFKSVKINDFKLAEDVKKELLVNSYIRDTALIIIDKIEDNNLEEVVTIIENLFFSYYNKNLVI